jgi:maleylpyruvate isomerase
MITLHNYFRSSASYRVRIALELKGLAYDYLPIHLTRDGGEQFKPDYVTLNPDALVPTMHDGGDGAPLTQSLAIIEYLDETRPSPPLLPSTPAARAHVRAIALQIACEIHPLNNLRVLAYLRQTMEVTEAQKNAWYAHWVEVGFSALETRLAGDPRTGLLCYGDSPTLADLCLVPQVFNARRMGVPLDAYPTIQRIAEAAEQIDAFARAAPAVQPDGQ